MFRLPELLNCAGLAALAWTSAGCSSPEPRSLPPLPATRPAGAEPDRSSRAASPGSTRVADDPSGDSDPLAGDELRLDALLLRALERNPGLLAARERAASVAQRSGHVGARPDPVVTLGWYAVPVRTRTGDQEWGLGLRQMLPWGGELEAKVRVAEREADAAAWRARIAEADLMRDVAVSFHELTYLHRAGELLAEIEADAGTLDVLAAAGRGAGHAGLGAQVRTGDYRAQLTYDRIVLEELSAVEVQALRALVGPGSGGGRLAAGAPVGIPVAISAPPISASMEALQARAEEANPAVALAQAEIARARAVLDRSGELRKPQFSIGARTIFTDELRTNPRGNGEDPVLLELGMSLPIAGGASRHLVQESRHAVRAAVLERDALVDRLRADVARTWWRARTTRRLVGLYRDSLLPQAERSTAAALALFEDGDGTFEALLEAFKTRQTHALGALRAEADHGRAVAELERLIGGPLEWTEPDEWTGPGDWTESGAAQ